MKISVAASFVFVLLCFCPVPAQDGAKHRSAVLANPDLVRYYLFDDSVSETKTVPNLAPNKDVEKSDLSWKSKHPLEIVDGPFAGMKAVQIDAGFFEAAKVGLEKSFCVELRIRKLGQGLERGNNGSTNGTLFGLGNGYDNGIRLTTDYPNRFLVFSIGRPENPKARSLVGNQPVPDGVWQHIACCRDDKTMRVYVDGILYGITDYDGVLTEPCWGFRVGFNNAGVGSVKMDVAEVAVYKSALSPEDVLAHALLEPKFPEKHAALLHAAIDAVSKKDYRAAQLQIDELLKLKMPLQYRFALRKFEVDLSAMSGNQTLARRQTASLLADPDLPKSLVDTLRRRSISSDFTAPSVTAPSGIYRQILDDSSIELDSRQRLATEKCFAEALFAEGKTSEAKKLLDEIKPRERELMREILQSQNVSAETTALYETYQKEHETLNAVARSGRNHPSKFDPKDLMKPESNPIPLPEPTRFYVALNGKAENSGTEPEPFATLVQARDAVRKQRAEGKLSGEVEIQIRGGVYPVTETFVLEKQDSGTVYRAYPNEKPLFSGGVSMKNFKKVDDPEILERLPKESREKVFVAPIPDGVSFPPVAPRGYGKNGLGAAPHVEMYIDDKPQQISRWPNCPKTGTENVLEASEKAFVKTGKVHRGFFNTKDSGQPGIFEYSDPRHERWLRARDAMLFGYWGHLWGITSCRIEKIDPATKEVVLATNNPYGYRENMPYYAFNLLEEIDEPGEWYLDRENGMLYVYPPDGIDLNAAKIRLSCFSKEFLSLKDVSNTVFHGLTFEEGTGNAANVVGGEDVRFVGCRFHRFGNWGLGLDGLRHSVRSCDFISLGGGGIHLRGGEIKSLTPGRCDVENCLVNDFSRVDRAYAPAVLIDGVGNRLAHNLFCDSPGHAIRVEGMEHILEFNEVHSVVYESDDQAGIDIWGNPFIRGMVFRYNYWHHIGSGRDVAGQAGIRLDDMISGVLIYGNVFFRSSGGHFGGVQIHGGKDNIVADNLMIDCKFAVSFSPWGEKRWLEKLEKDLGPSSVKRGFDPESEVYRAKYPDYAELKLNADRNLVIRNAAIGCDLFARNNRRNLMLENVSLPWMPGLFPETKSMKPAGDSRVPSDARKIRDRLSIPFDSPIYELTGIHPLPVDRMGLYLDEVRTELPKTEVTPFFVLE